MKTSSTFIESSSSLKSLAFHPLVVSGGGKERYIYNTEFGFCSFMHDLTWKV